GVARSSAEGLAVNAVNPEVLLPLLRQPRDELDRPAARLAIRFGQLGISALELTVASIHGFGDVGRAPFADTATDATALQDHDALARLGQQQGGRDPGQTAADNRDIDLTIGVEP